MRIIGSAAVAALLLVGSSAWVAAQDQKQPAQKNSPTKVYSYEQKAPTAKAAVAQQQKQRLPEADPDLIPYGSQRWWDGAERALGSE